MVKKAVLSLVLLTVLGAAVFAEYYNGYEYRSRFVRGNMSSTEFLEVEDFPKRNPELVRTSKLPNSVFQVISRALEDYTLDVGDCFGIEVTRGDTSYTVILRITNRNGAYEYYAFYGLIGR
ncbi:hypothetical protein AGMMS49579_15030 [Spirochaetia bacterium]|nr:hypothetical protein AGMMS49579_15030 [Spirochaetia bacterium]